ncbi:MAG: hypothetical protein HZB72_15505 [Burkholderiales bacterium]|nr:hypothetical protein [Burkholderiales bacterium]
MHPFRLAIARRLFSFSASCVVGLLGVIGSGAGLPSHAAAADADGDKRYGQHLVAEYEVPAEAIAAFAKFKASKPVAGESAQVNVLLADTQDWTAPEPVTVEPTRNPYTIVLRLRVRAVADGDAATMWQAGWVLEDGVTRGVAMPGLAKPDAKAGEIIELAGAAPVSFKEGQKVTAQIGLVNARNVEIRSAKVQVWQGIGEATGVERFLSLPAVLVGLVMVALTWWFFVRR